MPRRFRNIQVQPLLDDPGLKFQAATVGPSELRHSPVGAQFVRELVVAFSEQTFRPGCVRQYGDVVSLEMAAAGDLDVTDVMAA
jgi:hypothetical protein